MLHSKFTPAIFATVLLIAGCASETPQTQQTQPETPENYVSTVVLDDGTVHYSDHPQLTESEYLQEINANPDGDVFCNSTYWPKQDVLKQEDGRIYYDFTDGPEWVDCDPNAVIELD